jgi:hypothetical protein
MLPIALLPIPAIVIIYSSQPQTRQIIIHYCSVSSVINTRYEAIYSRESSTDRIEQSGRIWYDLELVRARSYFENHIAVLPVDRMNARYGFVGAPFEPRFGL